MGLVAVDVVTALTVGRGGRVRRERRWAALPAQRPRAAAPAVLPERSAVHRQVGHRKGPHRRLQAADLHRRGARRTQRPHRMAADSWSTCGAELLPLLFAEMYARYYAQVAFQASGAAADGAAVREQLRAAWAAGPLRRRAGTSRRRASAASTPQALFFGHQPEYRCSDDYERFVYDVAGRRPTRGRGARRRQPGEVGRPGVPDLPGHDAFGGRARRTVARLLSRLQRRHLQPDPPPGRRSAGAALPAVPRADGRRRGADAVRSRPGSRPGRERSGPDRSSDSHLVDRVRAAVRGRRRRRDPGHLEEPRIAGSASELLTQLYNRGRVSQFRYGDGDGRQRRPDAGLPSDRHRRPAAGRGSGCSAC